MINRQSQAFSCNSGNNCTRNRLNCTLCNYARATIPELHSKACDYKFCGDEYSSLQVIFVFKLVNTILLAVKI